MASTPPRSNSSSLQVNPLSHGRGGAGNIGYAANDVDPFALETPHLKSEVYTTGRGGTGNMAKNTDAEEARRAQDVVGLPRSEAVSNTHVGRGGEGNVVRPISEPNAHTKPERILTGGETEGESHAGLAEKGKQWLMHKVGKS